MREQHGITSQKKKKLSFCWLRLARRHESTPDLTKTTRARTSTPRIPLRSAENKRTSSREPPQKNKKKTASASKAGAAAHSSGGAAREYLVDVVIRVAVGAGGRVGSAAGAGEDLEAAVLGLRHRGRFRRRRCRRRRRVGLSQCSAVQRVRACVWSGTG